MQQKIINCEKKEMIPLTVKEGKLYHKQKFCYICKKGFSTDDGNKKKDFNKELIKRSANIYEFCDGYINKFILLLRKGVFAYEYMHSWKRFNETSLPNKKEFYSSLNTEDITVLD